MNTNETSYSMFLMVFFSRLNVMRIIGWIMGCCIRLCLLGLFKSERLIRNGQTVEFTEMKKMEDHI